MDCKKIEDLKFERSKLLADARKLADENNSDHAEQVDKMLADVESLNNKIEHAERMAKLERQEAVMRQVSERKVAPTNRVVERHQDGNRNKALQSWFTRKFDADSLVNAESCGMDITGRSIMLDISKRSLTTSSALDQYNLGQDLDKALKFYGNAKSLVKNLPTPNGLTLPIPTSDDTANMAEIVSEGGAVSLTPDPTTNVVNIGSYLYSTRAIQVSLNLLQDSVVPMDSYVADALAERLGRKINSDITVGTGTGMPWGIFPRATASGVVVTGTVASPTFSMDLIYDCIASVDVAYRNAPNVGFMMSDAVLWRFRRVKDSTGQYLWQPSVQAGQPDRLAGYPVYVNNDCPSFAVNNKIVAFGDFSKYVWREVNQLELRRLDELYIANGLVAWLGFYRASGDLVNTAAVKTIAAPAS